MRTRSFSKNSWNVFRWYMFNDSKKLATKKTQRQLALLHIKWQERRRRRRRRGGGGYINKLKRYVQPPVFTWPWPLQQDCLERPSHDLSPSENATACFYLLLFFQKKRTHSQAYKLFTLYYPAKLRKYTVAACWDFFFSLQKKKTKTGYIETLKEYRQNS